MSVDIPVNYKNDKINLRIVPESGSDSLNTVDDAQADEYGEAKYQLMESCAYEYKIFSEHESPNYYLEKISEIVKPFKTDKSMGRITPGIYIGLLTLELMEDTDEGNQLIKKIPFEVRSVKQDYRSEYRHMLEEITDFCTELIMQCNSPVLQKFSPDFSRDPKIVYQQFAFVKSILDSDTFDNAVFRIINTPVTKWKAIENNRDIRKIRKVNSAVAKQIVSRSNRIKTTNISTLSNKMDSLPLRVKTSRKIDTNDTVENQFVKHVLSVFYNFCADIKNIMKKESRERKEAEYLESKLEQILNRSFFKEISSPKIIPLHSPVLQRKDGYRELLQIWLKFDLASGEVGMRYIRREKGM
ncbi:MAG: DUF2357 domain-containing protein [Candidatus Marinimicrobia bacterium]|nr:DUF2357 domain-containing protein [Candidatus Neomarinimicrobiota bacterium]